MEQAQGWTVKEHLVDSLASADAIPFEISRRDKDNHHRMHYILLTVNLERSFHCVGHPERGERLDVVGDDQPIMNESHDQITSTRCPHIIKLWN
jgi:hypothetical protein